MGYEASSEETKEANRELNPATEEVRFLVENDNLVAEHNLKNQRTVGSFSVTKEGEFFTGIRQNLLKMIFQYLFGRVEQVQFDVFVRDDIFTPDGTGRYAEWTNSEGETLELKKDVKIETVKTDRTGIASVKNLPLGSYYIREVKAGDGSFLLNPEVKDVVLVYEGQEVPVVWAEDTPYINERQKVSIKLVKYSDKNLPVEGAVFGLFAEEDLYGYVISGERVVTLIANRGLRKKYLAFFEEHHITVVLSTMAAGTTSNTILDALGLEATEKTVYFALLTKDTWKSLKKELKL